MASQLQLEYSFKAWQHKRHIANVKNRLCLFTASLPTLTRTHQTQTTHVHSAAARGSCLHEGGQQARVDGVMIHRLMLLLGNA